MNKRKRDANSGLLSFLTFSNIAQTLIILTLCVIFVDALKDALLDTQATPTTHDEVPTNQDEAPINDEHTPRHCDEAMFDIAIATGWADLNCTNPITLTTTKTITEDTIIGAPDNNLLIIDGNATLYDMFIVQNGASLEITNIHIRNSARNGIQIAPDSTLLGEQCILSGHGSPHDDGAAIWNAGGTVVLTNCVIEDNHSYDDAAGILNERGGLLDIQHTTFRNNSAGISANGTGAAIHNNGTANIFNSEFVGNRVHNSSGGNIISLAGEVTIIETIIRDNSAALSGGGIYNSIDSQMTLIDSILSANSAEVGSDVYNMGTLTLANTQINSNTTVPCFSYGILHDASGACDTQ